MWDYPRPPAIVPDGREVVVADDHGTVASTDRSLRVLETASPPAFYLPPESVIAERMVVVPGSSHCEWKGEAEYLAVVGTSDVVGWRYPAPYPDSVALAGWVSFYPGRIRCAVAGEVVRPQAGGFYGGWITDEIVGPFKGEPGTGSW